MAKGTKRTKGQIGKPRGKGSQSRNSKTRNNGSQNGESSHKGTPPVFLVIDGDQGSDPLLSVMARLTEVRNASTVPKQRDPSLSDAHHPSNADRKRWPVELLRTREAGFLAMRVEKKAGLEPYGIAGGDI
ncbi:MAG: hypothetical protein ACREDR_23370, partial [Blastocatellia bacterium]